MDTTFKAPPNRFNNAIAKLFGRKSKIGKLISNYQKLREAHHIASHFSTYLSPVVAKSNAMRDEAFRIRHSVYCEELNFEPLQPSGLEMDQFDGHSHHCLIQHSTTQQYAGTVRLVHPQTSKELLPIEKFCLQSITNEELNPANHERGTVCEISRLAVPYSFRRRVMDRFDGAATGAINEITYSETELRCFPFIAVGLYFSAAALAIESQIKHAYVMMEPRLARSMGFIGIKFEQIGPVIDYHGRRAPYYINQKLLQQNLSQGFSKMLGSVHKNVAKQVHGK